MLNQYTYIHFVLCCFLHVWFQQVADVVEGGLLETSVRVSRQNGDVTQEKGAFIIAGASSIQATS